MPLSPALLAVLLQASSATPEAPAQEARFEARFADGLHYIGPGEEWEVHLGGRYMGNEQIVFGQPEDSGYRTRQALVRLDAEGWKDFSLRITGDFTPVAGERAARLF